MKRIITIIIMTAMVLCLASCSDKNTDGKKESAEAAEVAMIAEGAELQEGSLSKDTWDSVKKVAQEKGLKCKYFNTENPSKDTYLASIQKAVEEGAKFIILPGSSFETAAFAAQSTYPEVSFLIIDGVPHDENNSYATSANTVSMVFAEEEAGYLAGYAAVKEGYSKLGFLGGQELPAIKRYGYGFVQGAAAAAAETETKVDMNYAYSGSMSESDEVEKLAGTWYKDKTEVIFACGGAMNKSVMKAAESAEKKVIGSDIDQSSLSETVITSAEKNLEKAIGDILGDYAKEKFVGGMAFNYAAKNDGIALEMKNSKLKKFTQEDYDAVFGKLKSGEIQLKKDTGVKSVNELAGDWINIK